LLSSKGLSPPLYARFNNGFIYGFLHGQVLNHQDLRNKKISQLIAKKLSEWHKINLVDSNDKVPTLLPTLNKWFNHLLLNNDNDNDNDNTDDSSSPKNYKKNKGNHLDPSLISFIRDQLNLLEQKIESIPGIVQIAFCHNDILSANIILQPDNNYIELIDFEYASFNYIAFDIANHFCEWAGFDCDYEQLMPNKADQLEWISFYLKYNEDYHDMTSKELYDQVQIFIKVTLIITIITITIMIFCVGISFTLGTMESNPISNKHSKIRLYKIWKQETK